MRWFLLLSLCGALVFCGTPPQTVTISGYDAASKTTITPINLWRDYADRSKGIAGVVQNGEHVLLIRQEGGGALVQKTDGVQGWLSAQFIQH